MRGIKTKSETNMASKKTLTLLIHNYMLIFFALRSFVRHLHNHAVTMKFSFVKTNAVINVDRYVLALSAQSHIRYV